MRILHLTHYFLPESFGGTQTYVANLARGQAARGHEPYVITGSPRQDSAVGAERGDWQGIPTLRIFRQRAEEMFSGDTGSPRITDEVLAYAREVQPDLVHLHHWHGLSRGLVAELKALGLPVVVTLHDLFATCMRFFRMPDPRRMCAVDAGFDDCARCVSPDLPTRSLEELEHFAGSRFQVFQDELARADKVLCVSAAQRELLATVPGFTAQLEPLPIGIPAPSATPAARRTREGQTLKVVSWGGIEPRKGIHLLAAAIAASVHRDHIELHLHGEAASSEYEQEIRNAAAGVSVFFHGRYEDEELGGFALDYDVAVFPFIAFETYALSVDEALHLGIPLLVCDRGAPKERIGGSGLVFPAEDIGALTAVIDRVFSDRGLLSQMQVASHDAVLIDGHIEQLLSVYQTVAPQNS